MLLLSNNCKCNRNYNAGLRIKYAIVYTYVGGKMCTHKLCHAYIQTMLLNDCNMCLA